nr:hypothetical protein [Clostridia bacterium]
MKTTAKRSRRNCADNLNDIPCEKMKPYQLIEKLFEDKPGETYSSQKILSNEINKHFKNRHTPITQPDVSKAFKRYEMYANVNGEPKLIYQINGEIKLFDENDSYESLILSLVKLNPFAKEKVIEISHNTYAYKLVPEKAEAYADDIKEVFYKCYGSDTIFSIVIYDDLMVVVADTELTPGITEKLKSIPACIAAELDEGPGKRKKKDKDKDKDKSEKEKSDKDDEDDSDDEE